MCYLAIAAVVVVVVSVRRCQGIDVIEDEGMLGRVMLLGLVWRRG